MGPLRAIFFDAAGTLFTERTSRAEMYAEVAAGLGMHLDVVRTKESMLRAVTTLPVEWNGHFRFTRGWFREFIRRVFAEQGFADLPPEAARRLFAKFTDPRSYRVLDDAPRLLQSLRPRVEVLGVISNWTPELETLLQGLGLRDRFDFVLSSALERCEKPGREIFERALERAGVRAEEALHVGDHPEFDLAGAGRAGLQARLVCRSPRKPPPDTAGYLVLSSLQDLQTAL